MKRTISLLLSLFLYAAVHAQSSMMDDVSLPFLDKLLEAGRTNYPKFKYTQAKTDAAKDNYSKAKCGVFDFITLGYVYFPGGYTVSENSQVYSPISGYQVGVFLNVGSILSKPAVVKEAKHEYVAAKMDKEVTDLDVEQEIRKRYFTYIQDANILKLKSKAMADADEMMQHAKYKFEKGEVALEVYNQALIAYSTYSQEKINAEAALLIAKTSLEEIVGTPLENIK